MEKVKIGVYIADILAILSDAVSKNMKGSAQYLSLLAIVGFAALVYGVSPALAVATAPPLGTAQTFGVLGASTVTNTGPTIIRGDLGLSPGTAVTGFPPGIVVPPGTIHVTDAVALGAQNDATTAYNNLTSQACTADLTGQDLGGKTLTPGVYCFSSSAQLTGALTLDAQGNPNSVFIFKTGSTLTTASSSSVLLINGSQSCNVFWQVGSSATLGTDTKFVGNIIALTSITLTTNATVDGRALARNGAVTLDTNNINASVCAGVPPTGGVGLFKVFSPSTIGVGGVSTLTITFTNTNSADATLNAPFTDNFPAGLVIAGTPNVSTSCGGTGVPTAVPGGTNVTLPAGRTIPGGSVATPGFCTLTVNVTAPIGSYLNTVPVNALVTSGGNNTVSPAVVILSVSTPAGSNIFGKTFNDLNRNGVNNGEPGLQGWTIILKNKDTGATVASTTTDSNGNYNFSNLPPGNYTIDEVQQGGWVQSAPTPIPPGNYTLIFAGVDVAGLDFGNYQLQQPGKVIGWGNLGSKGSFNIWVYSKFMYNGKMEFTDKINKVVIKATRFDSVMTDITTMPKTGTITGMATVNGAPYAFTVKVVDAADPGAGKDMFTIDVSSPIPYHNSGTLTRGDITVVK